MPTAPFLKKKKIILISVNFTEKKKKRKKKRRVWKRERGLSGDWRGFWSCVGNVFKEPVTNLCQA
jgi:hypothetical protein